METGESWEWEKEAVDEYGSALKRIGKRLEGVNVMNEEDWPAIISFLKPRIIALDRFWANVRYGFEGLV
jgi:hypothetical protein